MSNGAVYQEDPDQYFHGFPLCLKVIKEQLNSKTHPLRKILEAFVKPFLYMNRHLLYSDKVKVRPSAPKNKMSEKGVKDELTLLMD